MLAGTDAEMCVESCKSIIRALTASKEHVVETGSRGMKTREQTPAF